jgi:hypothetical protein
MMIPVQQMMQSELFLTRKSTQEGICVADGGLACYCFATRVGISRGKWIVRGKIHIWCERSAAVAPE